MRSLRTMDSNEVLDDLQNGYYIIQRSDGFKFGIDAVLLADFAKESKGLAMDLCTGTGIVPLLLAAKSGIRHIDAVEIQPQIAEMAQRSVAYNKLNHLIDVRCMDLLDAPEFFGKGVYDTVTVNPPYMKAGSGLVSDGDTKTISRHEVKCSLEEVVRTAAVLLKPHGRLYMVHRPARLVDIFSAMRKYRLEPKIMRPVMPKPGKEMNLVLICGIKCANSELRTLPPLYVYDSAGNYSKEIDEIYGR